jgi:hypothetical protein
LGGWGSGETPQRSSAETGRHSMGHLSDEPLWASGASERARWPIPGVPCVQYSWRGPVGTGSAHADGTRASQAAHSTSTVRAVLRLGVFADAAPSIRFYPSCN